MTDDKITISMDEVDRATPVPGSSPTPFFTPAYTPPESEPAEIPKRTGFKVGIAIAVVALLAIAGIGVAAIATSKGGVPEPPINLAARLIEEAIEYDHRVSQETIGRKATVDGVNADCDEESRVRRAYVSRMQTFLMSNSDLPADFRAILFEHISAHNRLADILASHPVLPNNVGEGLIIGFLNGITGKFDGGSREINQWIDETKNAERRISETWDAVLQCAIKYGARINQEE